MRREPIIHFASRSDAEELAHNGPALCRAGRAHRSEHEQVVSGNWEYVTCKTCHRLLKKQNQREDREEAEVKGQDIVDVSDGVFAVVHDWERRSDGPSSYVVAIFSGKNAEKRAEKRADREARDLANGRWLDGERFNVYRITGADDYRGNLDSADWDVDVLVEKFSPDMFDPDRRARVAQKAAQS